MLLVFHSHEVSNYSAGEFCHSDVIYFAHVLVIDRTPPMCARVLTLKSEEEAASFASLLATPLTWSWLAIISLVRESEFAILCCRFQSHKAREILAPDGL